MTKDQQITCHPPKDFVSFAPSAYPMPHKITARTINKSPIEAVAVPFDRAYPATNELPIIENNQNTGLGYSPPLSTAKMAVTSGSNPKKTIEWEELTYCRASAVSNGKPMTTPIATIISDRSCLFWGIFSLKIRRMNNPNRPAIDARENVKKKGLSYFTANFVAGRDPLKIITPTNPFTQPESAVF